MLLEEIIDIFVQPKQPLCFYKDCSTLGKKLQATMGYQEGGVSCSNS